MEIQVNTDIKRKLLLNELLRKNEVHRNQIFYLVKILKQHQLNQ